VNSRKRYAVRVERSGEWWAITIPGLKGAHSQARRLDQVEANAKEVISLITGSPEDSFDVEVERELPESMTSALAGYLAAVAAMDDTRMRFETAQTAALGALLGAGLTVRDVGALMGISHQRVSQLKPAVAPQRTSSRKSLSATSRDKKRGLQRTR